MIGDLGRGQPVTPEIDRGVQRGGRLLLAGRDLRIAPRQHHKRRLALGERGAAVGARTHHAQLDAARQLQLHVPLFGGDRHRVIPVALVAPRSASGPVIEQRGTVHHDLNVAADTRRDPHQGTDRAGIGRRPPVVRPPRRVFGRAHRQEILDDHPPRRRLPRGFQHHRPRHIPPVLRNLGIAGTEPEQTSRPVQKRREHTRGIRAGQAQPLDRPIGRDQAALLTIRQQPILGNRRKIAHRA